MWSVKMVEGLEERVVVVWEVNGEVGLEGVGGEVGVGVEGEEGGCLSLMRMRKMRKKQSLTK